MDNRHWAADASGTPPTPPASPSVGYPSAGDPSLGIAATKGGAFWFHQIGEELRGVLIAAGLTPSTANNTQLLEAIQRLIDAQSGNYALDTGAANAYVVALSPAIAAYADGMTVRVKAVNANTGASTLNAGAGVVGLVNDVGIALKAGDVPAGGIITATYIASAAKFYITSLVQSRAGAIIKLDSFSTGGTGTAAINFTGIDGSKYSDLFITGKNINCASPAQQLYMRLSTGSGFITSGYSDGQHRTIQTGAAGDAGTSNVSTWQLAPYVELIGTLSHYSFEAVIRGAGNSNASKFMNYSGAGLSSNLSNLCITEGGGGGAFNSSWVDGISIFSSVDIFGDFELFGRLK